MKKIYKLLSFLIILSIFNTSLANQRNIKNTTKLERIEERQEKKLEKIQEKLENKLVKTSSWNIQKQENKLLKISSWNTLNQEIKKQNIKNNILKNNSGSILNNEKTNSGSILKNKNILIIEAKNDFEEKKKEILNKIKNKEISTIEWKKQIQELRESTILATKNKLLEQKQERQKQRKILIKESVSNKLNSLNSTDKIKEINKRITKIDTLLKTATPKQIEVLNEIKQSLIESKNN